MKVCLVADSLGPDAGTERLVAALASSFDPKVVEAHVCCLESSERLSSLPPQIKTVVFPAPRIYSFRGLRQVRAFRHYLKQHQIDVVHSVMNNSAMFSVLAARGGACDVVITSRLNCGYWYTKKWIWAFRALNRYTTHVLTNSALAKKVTVEVERLAPEKITVFYPGVNLAQFARSSADLSNVLPLGIPADAVVVGIVANFRRVKNLHLFLRAAALVAAAVPKAAFLLVGQGGLKGELQLLAADLGIAGRVFFSSTEVPVRDYLARMSVACLSSDSEGLPNAILEYMAAGLPVVATDVGGVSELIHDGSNGYLVAPGMPAALAGRLIELLQNSELCTAMGQKGLERARADFDGAAAIEWLQNFYIEAVAERRGAARVKYQDSTGTRQ